MSGERIERLRQLFEAALLLDPPSRREYLRDACGEDKQLREEVETLLSAREQMGGFLETPASERLLRPRPPHIEPGTRVGNYEIVRVLGAGGSATVYEAVQQSPRRRVALKILHADLASEATIRRFRDEAEILARLQHPDIAHVYEAGVFESNGHRLPWFALEHVESGRDILEHIAAESLNKCQRLALFARICQAIHHGHQKGIIHRDIKPENLLIDGAGRPKVIDFGIAKLAGLAGTPDSAARELAGTLPYMSPEQCRLLEGDVDVRSDVYALGVLLYEVLTGRLPHEVSHTPVSEATRRIQEEAPTPIAKLDRSLRGDIELIVHKALARYRADRYQSAADLGRDVRRYLEFKPISARRPTLGYQVRLLARRRTAVVIAIAALLAVLVGGAVVSTMFAVKADKSRRAAVAARNRERVQSYVATISAVDAAIRVHDVAEARRRLRQAAVAGRNWEWWYLAGRLDCSSRTLRGSTSHPIRHLAIDSDRSRILAASHDPILPSSSLFAWDVESGEPLIEYGPAATWIRCPVWSPSGPWIAWGESSGAVVIADPDRPDQGQRSACAGGEVTRVAFHPDGSRLVSASEDGSLRMWSVPDGEFLGDLAKEEGLPADISFDPEGARLAVCVDPGTSIRIHDLVERGAPLVLEGHRQRVNSVGYAPDGRRLVSGSMDGTLRIWDSSSGEVSLVLTRDREPVLVASFCPEGDRILSGHLDGTLTVWDATTGIAIETVWGHTQEVDSVAWGSDPGVVHSASRDGTVKTWRLGAIPGTAEVGTHKELIRSLAYSPDGSRLACASFDDTVKLHDPATGADVGVLEGHRDDVQCVTFFEDSLRLVSGSMDATVRVWDLDGESCDLVCRGHSTGVLSVAVEPGGRRLASGSTDHMAIVWDADTGERLFTLPHPKWVWAVAFRDEPRELLTAGADGVLRFWSLDSGTEVRKIRTGSPELKCAVFSRDGSRVICGGEDGRLGIWAATTGAEILSIQGFDEPVTAVALSPDERRLIAAAGRAVRLWDIASGQLVLNLRGHQSHVYGVSFHPDGTQLATGGGGWVGEGCSIRLWGRVPGQPWPPDVQTLLDAR